jgi:hypothetical protein
MPSRVRLLVAVSVLVVTLVVPAGSAAHASTRCDPLRYNSTTNSLRQKASNGALLVEYHVTVTWCTAPNNAVQARVYSPQRSHGFTVTAAGLLVGWSFDRVLGEQRSYFTYHGVPYGGYYVNTQVNFIRCLPTIVPVCTNQSGWLHTYVHYDRTAIAVRGWK